MNLFQLLFKQMRQPALGTTLTMLSVVLGVGLAVSIMLLYHAGATLFGQSDYGFDVLVGKSGSKLQLTLNTIYQLDVSPGNIPIQVYDELNGLQFRPEVRIAVPYVVGEPSMASIASSARCPSSSAMTTATSPGNCPSMT